MSESIFKEDMKSIITCDSDNCLYNLSVIDENKPNLSYPSCIFKQVFIKDGKCQYFKEN